MGGAQVDAGSAAADVYRQDVDFLEHVVERWWANRDIHAGQDQVDFEAVFASLRERVRSASSLWDFAVALREELWALKDGHLRVGSTFQRADRRFSSGTRFTVTVDGVALAGVPEYVGGRGDRFARGDLLLEIDGQAADEYLPASG